MVTTFTRHRVRDYAAWKQLYDSVAGLRTDGGVLADSVYRDMNDPNTVLIMHQWASVAAAEAFMANPSVAEALRRGGVEDGTVRVEVYEEM